MERRRVAAKRGCRTIRAGSTPVDRPRNPFWAIPIQALRENMQIARTRTVVTCLLSYARVWTVASAEQRRRVDLDLTVAGYFDPDDQANDGSDVTFEHKAGMAEGQVVRSPLEVRLLALDFDSCEVG